MLVVFGTPVAIVFIHRYFKFRDRELEMEKELHGRFTEKQRKSLEARVSSLETSAQAILQIVAHRPALEAAKMAAVAEAPPVKQEALPSPSPGRERT